MLSNTLHVFHLVATSLSSSAELAPVCRSSLPHLWQRSSLFGCIFSFGVCTRRLIPALSFAHACRSCTWQCLWGGDNGLPCAPSMLANGPHNCHLQGRISSSLFQVATSVCGRYFSGTLRCSYIVNRLWTVRVQTATTKNQGAFCHSRVTRLPLTGEDLGAHPVSENLRRIGCDRPCNCFRVSCASACLVSSLCDFYCPGHLLSASFCWCCIHPGWLCVCVSDIDPPSATCT